MAENLNLSIFSRVPFVLVKDGTLTREALMAMAVVQRRTGDLAGLVYADTITNVPAGTLSATDVQAALNELDTEKASASTLTAHTSNTSNPHAVTKAQVGLGNCDNTSDANKPVSTATATALALKADSSSLGTMSTQNATGVAITGGAINGATIGATTPAAGTFTTVKTATATVASLPAGSMGMRHFVTDANATTFNSIVAGGGTNKLPVFHDGTDWRIG